MAKKAGKKTKPKGKGAKQRATGKAAKGAPKNARNGAYGAIAAALADVRARLEIDGTPGEQVRVRAALRNIDTVSRLLGLSRSRVNAAGGGQASYGPVRAEILNARAPLEREALQLPPGARREELVAAIRDLDISLVLLECNQSLSPKDYHTVPWKHLPDEEAHGPGLKADGTPL